MRERLVRVGRVSYLFWLENSFSSVFFLFLFFFSLIASEVSGSWKIGSFIRCAENNIKSESKLGTAPIFQFVSWFCWQNTSARFLIKLNDLMWHQFHFMISRLFSLSCLLFIHWIVYCMGSHECWWYFYNSHEKKSSKDKLRESTVRQTTRNEKRQRERERDMKMITHVCLKTIDLFLTARKLNDLKLTKWAVCVHCLI